MQGNLHARFLGESWLVTVTAYPIIYPKRFIRLLMRIRRRIETVIGQLSERFHIEKVRARYWWHLSNRLNRKILAHLVCSFIKTLLYRPAIQFNGLVQI